MFGSLQRYLAERTNGKVCENGRKWIHYIVLLYLDNPEQHALWYPVF